MGSGGDPDFGYGVGMIRTSDGGKHWNYKELNVQGIAYDIDFRNETEVWSPLGQGCKFIYSMDAGTTWKSVFTPDSVAIYDVTFPDSLHGFAVGQKGAMLKYKPRTIPSVGPIPTRVNEFMLYQNFPNPFGHATKLQYSIPAPECYNHQIEQTSLTFIAIRIYDMIGNEKVTLTSNDLSPGLHELEFSAGNLPDGLYFYQLLLITNGKSLPVTVPGKLIILR
jgi:hypothetical protein